MLGKDFSNFFKPRTISSNMLQFFHKNYHTVIAGLLYPENSQGIILRHPYSVEKGTCFGYALRKDLIGNLELNGISRSSLTKNLVKKRLKVDPSVHEKFDFLLRFFNTKDLQIDVYRALKSDIKNQWCSDNPYSVIQPVLQLHNGDYRISLNTQTDGRVHTPLTRLHKPFRRYTTYKGKPLSEVDVSNAVPLFIYILSKLARQTSDSDKSVVCTPRNPSSGESLDRTRCSYSSGLSLDWTRCFLEDELESFLSMRTYKTLIMSVKKLRTLDMTEFELLEKTTTDGSFYSHFMNGFKTHYSKDQLNKFALEICGERFDWSETHLRKITKKRILAMIYGKKKQHKIEQKIFRQVFPTLLDILNKLKISGYGVNRYKNLAHLFMQFEAYIMIDKCARKFNQKYARHAPVFTLHDCLITTEDYAPKLKEVINDEFQRILGVSPGLKVENWTDAAWQ